MTAAAFRSLGPSMFATLSKARSAHVAAGRAYDAAQDACTCRKGCTCSADERGAWRAYQDAGAALAEREAAWAAYCAAR